VIGERHMGPIDLVLTDIVTTDMSGHVLAERLAQFRPEIRVL
jgi:CheY-like chemotaxis protein